MASRFPAPPPRARRASRPLLALALVALLAGCGGAGYGDPVEGGGAQAAATTAGGDVGTTTTAPSVTTTTGPATAATTRSTTSGASGGGSSSSSDANGTGGGDGSSGSGGSGGSGGSSASSAQFARAAEQYCSGLQSSTQRLVTVAQTINQNNIKQPAVLKRAGRAIVAFRDGVSQAASTLRSATAPAAYRSYQTRTLQQISAATSAIQRERSGVVAGNISAILRVGQQLQKLQTSPVATPAALARQAPSCAAG